MQIKQQQSIVGLLICARSWVKFPNVLRDVHRAIRVNWGMRREESAALKDGNGCHLFTVKLILSSLPPAFVCSKAALCYFVSGPIKPTVFTAILGLKILDGTKKKGTKKEEILKTRKI